MSGNLPFLLVWGGVLGSLSLLGFTALGTAFGARVTKNPTPTLRTRIKHGAVTALGLLVLSTAIGHGASWLGKSGPSIGLRWLGISIAALTPVRGKALAAAERLLAVEMIAAFPEDKATESQYYRMPTGLGGKEAARYVALARLRKDCDGAPETLSSLAVPHGDLSDVAAELSLSCKRPLDLSRMAEARFWESNFEASSSLFDRAEVVWGETDKDAMYARNLVNTRTKKEIFTHWYAAKFDRARRTIERYRGATKLECLRLVMSVVANEPGALDELRKRKSECPVHLANLDPPFRGQLLKEHSEAAHRDYLYQSWALELEPLLADGVSMQKASLQSSVARIESPHEILSFSHGTRRLDVSIVAELLARIENDPKPSPARRLVRARMAATVATAESLFGEHATAQRLAQLARKDLEALLALPIAKDELGPSQYAHDSLELEVRLAAVLELGVALLAGNVARAKVVADGIPELVVPQKDKPWLDSEIERLRASIELGRAYVELWQGKPERLKRFADSKECAALSGCFVVRGNIERLVSAARGEVTDCEAHACLVAARLPSARAQLIQRLDESAGSAAVTENPMDRMYRIGLARTLARSLEDGERNERFTRWSAAVRPIALDPRLAVARQMLDRLN